MIAVEVGDEDICDSASSDLKPVHLCLGSLSAIDQKGLVVHRQHLRGRMAIVHGQGRIISEYGDCEHKSISEFTD
jgi:hypothetical protein